MLLQKASLFESICAISSPVFLSRFYFNNMIDSKNSTLLFGDKSLGKTSLKVSRMFICSISDRDGFFHAYPNLFGSYLKLSCFMHIDASYKQSYFYPLCFLLTIFLGFNFSSIFFSIIFIFFFLFFNKLIQFIFIQELSLFLI